MHRLAYVFTSLASVAACAAVLVLSQFAEAGQAYQHLPFMLIILLGFLFAAPLHAFREHINDDKHIFALSVSALALVFAWGLARITLPSPVVTDGVREVLVPSTYFALAPIVALAFSEFLRLFPRYASLIAAMTVYISCTLLANYTFNSFLPLPLYGLVNVGTLFFGITFTQRDRVHHYGRKWAYLMIAIAALSNFLLALYLGTPVRYVWVSFAAIIISEFTDTQIYHSLLQRNWWLRVGASNAVSIPLDTIIFTVFAFYGEPQATGTWLREVILTDIVVKLTVGFIAAVRVKKEVHLPPPQPPESARVTTLPL